MSTVTKIVDRPKDAPKAPVYPRLLRLDGTFGDGTIVWATSENKNDPSRFVGVVVIGKGSYENKEGHFFESWGKSYFVDFPGAVTIYNK